MLLRTKAFSEARQKILDAREIVVAGHVSPDGDCIGSLLALGLGIESLGKRVHMVSSDGVPKLYRFLPGADRVVTATRIEPDLAIALDCGSRELLGRASEIFTKATCTLEIDHHEFRRPFADISVVDPGAAAVGELVYRLLEELEVPLTREIGQSILTSLLVETNSFRLSNVTPFTFQLCVRLAKAGVDFSWLAEKLFWSRDKETVVLSGLCLSRCRFLKKGRIAWSIVRKQDYVTLGAGPEHVHTVPMDMISIRDVQIAVFFKEKDNRLIRVSLRSRAQINIASLAERYGGGGHFDAAGCEIPNDKDAMEDLLTAVGDLLRSNVKRLAPRREKRPATKKNMTRSG